MGSPRRRSRNMSRIEFVASVEQVIRALHSVVEAVENGSGLSESRLGRIAAMDLEGCGHDLIEIAARYRIAKHQADELAGRVEADLDQVPDLDADNADVADFWAALERCCDLHQDNECCDPQDCGPCCAACPTRPRTGEEGGQ